MKGDYLINVEKYPQYQLYKFTRKLYANKEVLVPKNCDNRCVYGTIINRCYYSSYLYLTEWLLDKGFKVKSKEDCDIDDEIFVSEHKQVRDALKDYGESKVSNRLYKLSALRSTADYEPYSELTDDDLNLAMKLMEYIFNKISLNNLS